MIALTARLNERDDTII